MKLSPWIIAARPRTLGLAATPVIVGAALAWAVERQLRWPAVLAALIGSILIQLGTNLHNDATGSKRGGDGPDRVGPPRATASGLLDEAAVNRAAFACFSAAALIGAYLIWVGGWPIFLLGVASHPVWMGLQRRPAARRLHAARGIVRGGFFWPRRRMWHILALHGDARSGSDRGLVLRWVPDRSGVVGQQSARRRSRCARRAKDFGHCGRADLRQTGSMRRLMLIPFALLASDRSRAPAGPCVAGTHPVAAGGIGDQPLRPRTARPRVQSDSRANCCKFKCYSACCSPLAWCCDAALVRRSMASPNIVLNPCAVRFGA